MRRTLGSSLLLVVLVAGLLPGPGAVVAAQEGPPDPEVRAAGHHDTSPPLRRIDAEERKPGPRIEAPSPALPLNRKRRPPNSTGAGGAGGGSGLPGSVPALPATAAPIGPMPGTIENFEGVGNVDGVLPPDTVGDVGPNHYVQMVNLSFAIWDREGNLLYGPVTNNTLWSGFGGPCESTNDGDPIVLYDALADRWMLSQFALPNFPDGPFYECIAVSRTGNPLGAYHRYEFLVSETKLDDYPKFGVWPDGYYMSINQFTSDGGGGFDWGGAGAVAFERDRMLQGLSARMVYFDLFGVEPNFGGMLPADLDGAPPPAGAPNVFAEVDGTEFLGPVDAMRLWDFHVDWSDPAASTFGAGGRPNAILPVAEFDYLPCTLVGLRHCVPQPVGPPLDAIGDRLMFRLQYRNFGTHESLVGNHTVDSTGAGHAAVRWYELRNTGGGWTIHQQGTHAPDVVDHRWMGSVALDGDGNLAAGYSASGPATFPSIRYAGRLADDPPNELTRSEATLVAGGGGQLFPTAPRWGDYSMMAVDPTDECTFWFTSEYYGLGNVSLADWQTRVGSFRFPGCTPPAVGTLTGRVREAGTNAPLPHALVRAGGFTAETDAAGFYRIAGVPPGSYDVTASAYGHDAATAADVTISGGATTVRDFLLGVRSDLVTISGRVTDGGGHGWPLYARIDISDYPPGPVFTDPATGTYSVALEPGSYAFTAGAVVPGYLPANRTVDATASHVQDFALRTDGNRCPPGYRFGGVGLAESFSSTQTPAGWAVVDNVGNGQVWRFDDPGGRGNLTGGAGGFATVDSDDYGRAGIQDTELVSPRIDLSEADTATLEFDTDFRWFEGGLDEAADVDISVDGGSTWTNVWRRQGASLRGPRREVVDVTAAAAGRPDVRLRFHYYDAQFEWWWQVDEVRLGEFGCRAVSGGLVVGKVADAATGAGLVGATVTSVATPSETATTMATPGDPRRDGLYVLFSSLTGRRSFRATGAGYAARTARAAVTADAVVARSFRLRAL